MQQLTQFCSLLTLKNLATLSFSGGLQMADKISTVFRNVDVSETTRSFGKLQGNYKEKQYKTIW